MLHAVFLSSLDAPLYLPRDRGPYPCCEIWFARVVVRQLLAMLIETTVPRQGYYGYQLCQCANIVLR